MSEREIDIEKPPVSIWKRLSLAGGVFALLLIVVAVTLHYQELARDRERVEKMRAEMADLDKSDPGWRLEDLEQARPAAPANNSAPVAKRAFDLTPRERHWERIESFADTQTPPLMLDAEQVALIDREMRLAEPALAEARKLAGMPFGRHEVEHSRNPVMTPLPEVDAANVVAQLLQFDALDRAHKGDLGGAVQSCLAILNAGRSLDDEPISTSQFVRMSCASKAARMAERVLALGEPPVKDLAELQKWAAEEEKHPALLLILRGKRAEIHLIMLGLADGRYSLKDLFITSADETETPPGLGNIKRAAQREHPRLMALLNRAIDNARLPPHEQAAGEKKLERELNSLPAVAELTKRMFPALNMSADLSRHYLARMRCLQAMLAAERYRRETGAWPKTLTELTPNLLGSVPADPFDGKPLRYRIVGDGVLVYSVGPDRKDNGGNIPRGPAASKGADVGYQLWNVRDRRRPAKPLPAK